MNEEFWYDFVLARDPGPPRPDIQAHARWINEHLPPPQLEGATIAAPLPGRGVSGESTN